MKCVGHSCDSDIGMCRQFIREFADLSLPIFMFGSDDTHVGQASTFYERDCLGKKELMACMQLLPMSFGPGSLPSPEKMASLQTG